MRPINSLKIQWNHLVYRDAFCCSEKDMYTKHLELDFNLNLSPSCIVQMNCKTNHYISLPQCNKKPYIVITNVTCPSNKMKWNVLQENFLHGTNIWRRKIFIWYLCLWRRINTIAHMVHVWKRETIMK
jgi:hypothetical protein